MYNKYRMKSGIIRRVSLRSICYTILAAGFFLTMVSFAFSGNSLVLSDDSSEWVLAKHLSDSRCLISSKWYYGTELHVFFTQLLNVPLIRLFSHWHTARFISIAVFLALLALCVLFLSGELELRENGILAAFALMIPFSRSYSYFGIYSGFYTFYHVLAFLVLALNVRILKGKGRRAALTAVLLLLAFLGGLNGIRMLIILYIPMTLTACLYLWRSLRGKNESAAEIISGTAGKVSLFVLAQTIFSAAGWLINEKILSRSYFFKQYKNNNLESFRLADVLNYAGKGVALTGYEGIVDFTSIGGIGQLFGFLLSVLLVCALIYCWRHRRQLTPLQAVFCLFSVIAYVSNVLIFYLGQQAEDRFLISSLCYLFVTFAIALNTAGLHEKTRRDIAASLLVICLFIQGISMVYADALILHRGEKTDGEAAAEWLVENGYHEGVASFGEASYLTYVSDGQLEMWHAGTYETEGGMALGPYEWEQAKEHSERLPQDHPFLLVWSDDGDKYDFLTEGLSPVWEQNGCRIYDVRFD